MKNLILSVSCLFLMSCSTVSDLLDKAGTSIEVVCDRHDALILGTLKPEDLTEAEKRVYLRTTALIRKLIESLRGE